MPKLIFHNGQKKEVSYNQAAIIYQIMQGNKEVIKREMSRDKADFAKKLAFIKLVKEVKFEKVIH